MANCLECNQPLIGIRRKYCSMQCKDSYWQANNRDKVLNNAAKYRNSEKGKLKRLENRHELLNAYKQWKKDNTERKRQLDKAYHEKMKGNAEYLKKRCFHEANRRAAKLLATPAWLTKEQKELTKSMYLNCPDGHHVDHIVPLQGENVSGLHVPWNLQWLPAQFNRAKGNRM